MEELNEGDMEIYVNPHGNLFVLLYVSKETVLCVLNEVNRSADWEGKTYLRGKFYLSPTSTTIVRNQAKEARPRKRR